METIIKKPNDYAKAIADLVTKMPVERAAQVYDFARFLQTQDDDWLNDTEEQLQAEDAEWQATFARQHEKFSGLAQAARAEIASGATQPLFDERGNIKTR